MLRSLSCFSAKSGTSVSFSEDLSIPASWQRDSLQAENSTTPTRRWNSSVESNECMKSARHTDHRGGPPFCPGLSRRQIGDSWCIDRWGCQIEGAKPCTADSTRIVAGLAGSRTHRKDAPNTTFRRHGCSAMMPGFWPSVMSRKFLVPIRVRCSSEVDHLQPG